MRIRLLFCALLLAGSSVSSLAAQGSSAISPGQRVSRTLEAGCAPHLWTLRVRRPGLVTIRVESPVFAPRLAFLRQGPDGWVEEGLPAMRDSGLAQVMRFPAPSARYAIRVDGDAGSGGAYVLSVIEGAPTTAARTGETVTGSLDGYDASARQSPLHHHYVYEDWVVVAGRTGDLTVRAHSPDFAVRVMVGVRDGDSFRELSAARAAQPGEEAALTVPLDPRTPYVVRVGGHTVDGLAGYGVYSLSVGEPRIGVLRAESGAHGRLQPQVSREDWSFSADRSGRLTVSVDSMAGAPTIEVAAAGEEAALPRARTEGRPHARTELPFQVERGWRYQIRVRGAGTSAYTLRVSDGLEGT